MAVIFTEGFDYYNGLTTNQTTTVGLNTSYNLTGIGNMGLNTFPASIRFGGQSLGLGGAGTGATATRYFTTSTTGAFTIGFAFYPTSYGIGLSTCPVSIGFGSGIQLGFITGSAGQFIVVRNGVAVVTSSVNDIPLSSWYYIEVEVTISPTVGTINIYKTGTLIASATGLNTQNLASNSINNIVFNSGGNSNIGNCNIDDVYVTDSATRLGEQRVVTSYPASDVLTTFWSSSTGGAAPYTMLAQTLTDGDATYASSNTFNSRLVVGMPALPVVPINVNAVQIVGFARKDETQFRQLALEYENTAGAVSTGSTYTLNTSYVRMQNLMPQNPLTSAPWTATDVNNMRIGARVTA